MGALKNFHHDELEVRRAVEDGGWETVAGNHYVITADDLEDGKNKLGIDVTHLPLDVPLCMGCDEPVADDGVCFSCCCIHADLAAPAELRPDHKGLWQ